MKMEKLCSNMDDDDTYSCFIEDKFKIKDCDRKEQLRHIRELEEQRNLQEQKEIELERIQRQIVNKLKITDKSNNEMKQPNTVKPQASVKPNIKQSEIKKFSKINSQTLSNTAQKGHGRRTEECYKSTPFHSDRNLSHDRSPYYKGTSYWRDGTRQRRPHRASRGRSSNYRHYHDRMENRNRSSIVDSQNEFDINEKQKIDHVEEQMKDYVKFEFPLELIPANMEEEEDMLKEAIALSKQQMFIEKLEKRGIDRAVEETTRSAEEQLNERKKLQKQFDNKIMYKKSKDASRTSFSNTSNDIAKNQKGANCEKQERNENSKTNFSGSSKLAYLNKTQKPELNDNKQNINVIKSRISHHKQGTENRYLRQTYKKSASYKQNPSIQKEPVTLRTDVEKPLTQSYSEKISFDTDNSNWKECARKDLKQLLHLDDSPDASVGTVDMENTTESLKANTFHCDTNTADNNNRYDTYSCENYHFYKRGASRDKVSARHFTKCHSNTSRIDNGNSYDTPTTKCSECFQNYNTPRGGNGSRLNKRRYLGMQSSSRPNNSNSNNSENICVSWTPYPKFVGNGKTDSIPPRFRKQIMS